MAEKELRDSRAGGGGQSREQRKAPFRLGASAAPKPRGPREDSVEQLRQREASLAALPLPLPLASKVHPFRALGLSAEAAEDLQTAGVTRPTPIQQLAIPELVQGVSAAVLAETGSGKTLAYCLPLATRLYAYAQLGKAHAMRRVPSTACPEALIIVPNRELGVQVAASARAAAAWCQPGDGDGPGTRPLCVVTLLGKDKMSAFAKSGGNSSAKSTAAASLAGAWGGSEGSAVGDTSADGAAFEAADIVIATPRTVLQLQKAGRLRLGRCRTVVLDEADELLSAGFVDDVATVVRSAAGEAGVGVFGQSVQVCGRNVDVSLLLQSRFLTYRTLSAAGVRGSHAEPPGVGRSHEAHLPGQNGPHRDGGPAPPDGGGHPGAHLTASSIPSRTTHSASDMSSLATPTSVLCLSTAQRSGRRRCWRR